MASITDIDLSKVPLPAFIDRKKMKKATVNGEEVYIMDQELPAYMRREKVRSIFPVEEPAFRRLRKDELRGVRRKAKTLIRSIIVEPGEILPIPGGNGEMLYFRVMERGWFSCRSVDVKGHRRIIIDQGKGAAVVLPDHKLYQANRKVKRG